MFACTISMAVCGISEVVILTVLTVMTAVGFQCPCVETVQG